MIRVEKGALDRFSRQVLRFAKDFPGGARKLLASSQRVAKPEFARAAGAVYNVGRNRILEGVKVSGFNTAAMSFDLVTVDKPISFKSYGAKFRKDSGIAVTILKAKGPQQLRHGFFRKKRFWERKGRERMPITMKHGPSSADMIANRAVLDVVSAEFWRRTEREARRLFERFGRG